LFSNDLGWWSAEWNYMVQEAYGGVRENMGKRAFTFRALFFIRTTTRNLRDFLKRILKVFTWPETWGKNGEKDKQQGLFTT